MHLFAADILMATRGSLVKGERGARINGISIDTRDINKGEVFFALRGKRYDGHDFIAELPDKGAVGAIVQKDHTRLRTDRGMPSDFLVVSVDDTLKAFGDTACFWRKKHPVPLFAIGGSCGKSTTKEMLAAILGVGMNVLKAEGNYNNLVGLPLTLLGLRDYHQVAVVELGISEKGEMERLTRMADPDIALITNIGRSHTATLGDIGGVARVKGELFATLKDDAIEILNIDDPWVVELAKDVRRRSVSYSLKRDADISLGDYKIDGTDKIKARFSVRGRDLFVTINSTGLHNLYNAAAAIAASFAIGVEDADIKEGLSRYLPLKGRMELIEIGDITVLNDTYNANPESMEAALMTLSNMPGRGIAVLGDMLELGRPSKDIHRSMGRVVQNLGIECLIVIGRFSRDISDGAIAEGMNPGSIHNVENIDEVVRILSEIAVGGDVILVKGSRAMMMERIVDSLRHQSITGNSKEEAAIGVRLNQ